MSVGEYETNHLYMGEVLILSWFQFFLTQEADGHLAGFSVK